MTALAERTRPSTSVKDWLPAPPAPSYVRPADWLALPAVNVGDQKFVGLHAVYDHGSNFCTMLCQAAYTVDWGDGTAPENVATNVVAYHNYVYANLGSGTLSARGYRQAIVTVTPQAGQNLTKVYLATKHNQGGLVTASGSGWLDIRMAGSLVSTLNVSVFGGGNVRHGLLEQFEYVGPCAATTVASMFHACTGLRSVLGTAWTALSTSFSSMFAGCSVLTAVPALNVALGTTFASMFTGCSTLTAVPALNAAAGTIFSNMFQDCKALTVAPALNTPVGTNFSSLFQNCSALVSVPLLKTALGTNFSNMFQGCSALPTVPLLNTAAGTNFSLMFYGCNALTSVPLLNTAAGTNFNNMFANCWSLVSVPLFNTALGTNFSLMFYSCSSLVSVPLLNTAAGTDFSSMFYNCGALVTVPALNMGAGTNFATMFQSCAALKAAPLVGTKEAINFQNCSLGPAELDAIYTALATVVGKTITVTGNWGAASDTPSIATAKGWTVTGT